MITAFAALSLAATVAVADDQVDAVSAASAAPASPTDRLYIAGKLGFPQPLGVQALASMGDQKGPRWDLDLLVEPSRYWQSCSLGGAFRPFHNALFLGARGRVLQLHPPFSRGYSLRHDTALALGPELGARWTPGKEDKLLISLGLGGLFTPWGRAAVPPMFTLDLGVGWKVKER
jgi:hypothetical protein